MPMQTSASEVGSGTRLIASPFTEKEYVPAFRPNEYATNSKAEFADTLKEKGGKEPAKAESAM